MLFEVIFRMTDFMKWLYPRYIRPYVEAAPQEEYEMWLSLMESVTNVCCVVTRYFGGVLLGAGGLTRAYTKGAKDALDAAGISVVRRWVETLVPVHTAFWSA